MKDWSQPLATPEGIPDAPTGRRLALLAKSVVSVMLLGFISRKVDWSVMASRLRDAAPVPLSVALALLIAAVFLAAFRWHLLAQATGARMRYARAVQLTFAGMFFGQVLPATVGGDVVRGALACRDGLPWRNVIPGIVLDRMTALLASVILILMGLPHLLSHVVASPATMVWAGIAATGVVAAVGAALCLDLFPLPAWLTRRAGFASVLVILRQMRIGLASQRGLSALGLSLVIHLSTVVVVILICAGIGIAIDPRAGLVVVPMAVLAAAVPISLNGWGVREGVMVAGFALFGMSADDAFLISVLLGFGAVLSVLPGSVTWMVAR